MVFYRKKKEAANLRVMLGGNFQFLQFSSISFAGNVAISNRSCCYFMNETEEEEDDDDKVKVFNAIFSGKYEK